MNETIARIRWSREVHGMRFIAHVGGGVSKNQDNATEEQKMLFRKHLHDSKSREKSFQDWVKRNKVVINA